MKEPCFRLLLVSDDPACESWTASLESEGFQVERAASGAAALRRLARSGAAPDLIVLDADPLDDAGLALLRELRRRVDSPELPVILTSGGADSERVVAALEAGADDHVPRAVDFPVLLARVRALLRGRRPAAAPASAAPAAAPDPTPGIPPGTVLDGKYEIGSLIGRGRFGMVYRARHLRLRRAVAVKVLRPGRRHPEESLARFRREGVSACRVEHPNAVTVLDLSATAAGVPFLVMELLEGHCLAEEIRRSQTLSPLRAAAILLPVCEVLAEAHALGIVHRDVKPHNVFLHRTRRGEVVKLLDFGISKLVDDEVLDGDGVGPGTGPYRAPEQHPDHRADVYGLGATLHEMLTGRPPGDGGHPLAAGVPAALAAVVVRAMAEAPEDRPTAGGLAREVVRALGCETPAAP
ncbi:MAG TPA: protein kinase [Thermoanaerobaculia bacterium]|jgi:CheY-like chemotaxis protein